WWSPLIRLRVFITNTVPVRVTVTWPAGPQVMSLVSRRTWSPALAGNAKIFVAGASRPRDASIMRALLPMVISLGRRWLLAGQCRGGAARPARWFRELRRWSGGNGGN